MKKSLNLWRAANKPHMRMEVGGGVEKTLIYAPVECQHILLFRTKIGESIKNCYLLHSGLVALKTGNE